jgi:hypothetical protein
MQQKSLTSHPSLQNIMFLFPSPKGEVAKPDEAKEAKQKTYYLATHLT